MEYDKISDAAGLFAKGDLIFTLNFDTLNFDYPEINLLPENEI